MSGKIAVWVLTQSLKDEKSLWRIIGIILAPFFIFLLVIACVFEFITTPELWGDIDYTDLLNQIEDIDYKGNDNVTGDDKLLFVGQLAMPCDDSRVTSDYGLRIHPIDKVLRKHTGMDFGTAWHSNIYTVADGVVEKIKIDSVFGRNITIKHSIDGKSIYSFYAHLSESKVIEGEVVEKGQVIALEGGQPGRDTGVGKSTGHHLHFEIRSKPNCLSSIDPKQFLGGFK